jgi:hypothetical protein
MSALSIAASAVTIPMVGVEFTVRHMKLQTAFTRVLGIWGAAFAFALAVLVVTTGSGVAALTIFWCGAFVAWFGVRSHIESSILLKMLVLLRAAPLTDAELVAEYTTHGGRLARVEELRRGGFIARDGAVLHLTRKGAMMLAAVTKLR